jgi:N-dimethylarginine dimethylaminohydrolase
MNTTHGADHGLATTQWNSLRTILEQAGAEIVSMDPVQGLPDLVFTANAAMIYCDMAIPSRFFHAQRQREEPVVHEWLAAHGFQLRHLKAGIYFEGAGDALFCGDTLMAGYLIRSAISGHREIGMMFGCRVISLELVNQRYYHLDTCFCPLAPGAAIYYPQAFDDYGRRALAEAVPTLIAVADEEAASFACNAVVVGKTVVTNVGCPNLHADLARHGYTPIGTPLGEFVKSGGSAKCLTLRLDGEEAAGWRS